MKKKWWIFGLVLVLALVGTVVLASDLFKSIELGDFTYRIRGDKGVITHYSGTTSELTLPESFEYEGETYPVAHVGKEAFADHTQLNAVVIGENILTVEDRAFSGCNGLTKVEFLGEAPQMGEAVFKEGTPSLKLMYPYDKSGYGEKFGYPAEPFYFVQYLDFLSEGGILPSDSHRYALEDTVQAQSNTGQLIRVGHTFKGWTTNPAGEGQLIEEGQSFQLTAETGQWYPFWEKNKYKVSFQTGGGTGLAEVIVEHGDKVVLPKEPTKKGSLFVQWTKDQGGVTPWSFEGEVVVSDTTLYAQWLIIPATPSSVQASSAGYDSIQIQWKGSKSAKSYVVYRSPTAGGTFEQIGETTTLSYVDKNRPYQQTFYYKLKALASMGSVKAESDYSAAASGQATLVTPPGFQAVRKEPQGVTLKWSATPGAGGYEIYRASSANGEYVLKERINTTTYTDPAALWTQGNYYKIRAYRSVNGSDLFSDFTDNKGFYRVGDQLAAYLSNLSNRNSVNEVAKRLRGGTLSIACVYFSAEALRRVGVPIRTSMGSIDALLPYLSNNGWVKNRDYTQLRKGDICFTRDSTGNPEGRPTHVFIFMGWVNEGDYSLAYICDNQSPYYEGQVLHTRYILERHEHNGEQREAFSFFMTLR